MKKFKITHEVPFSLLEWSQNKMDYQYCLPHLLDLYPEYKSFFSNYRKEPNSFIIMDNGLFEGVSHTEMDLLEKINTLNPDIFIVPDKWNDAVEGYKNAKYWMNVLKSKIPNTTQLMVVLQGESLFEIQRLYRSCEELGYTHFAFNHSSIAYQNQFFHPNPIVNQSIGRMSIISYLRRYENIKHHHYIHLLGASHINEMSLYNDPYYEFINSIDTSLPVINAFEGIRLNLNDTYTKPTKKIEDYFNVDVNNEILELIENNIDFFKKILGV